MFIPSLDLAGSVQSELKATIDRLGAVLLENGSVDAVKALIQQTGSTLYWVCASNVDEAVNFWDAGVYKVVFPAKEYQQYQDELSSVPEERIAVEGTVDDLLLFESYALKPSVYIVKASVKGALGDSALQAFTASNKNQLLSQGGERRVVIQNTDELTLEDIAQLHKVNLDVAVPATKLTTAWEEESGKLNVGKAFLASATTDRPDGLYTTMVVDERNSALGLVYSSTQSVSEALRTGQGVYQSRKHGLWYKGATSGATQTLIKVDYDCDGDALRFVVKQHGAGKTLTSMDGSMQILLIITDRFLPLEYSYMLRRRHWFECIAANFAEQKGERARRIVHCSPFQ